MKMFLFALLIFGFSFAQPELFAFEPGVSTKERVLNAIRNEGGEVIERRNRAIKENIVNPEVEEIVVKGLPVENLKEAKFWFYKDRLFRIEYIFPFSKTEFYHLLYRCLTRRYGNPKKRIEHTLANGLAEWDLGEVYISLTASR